MVRKEGNNEASFPVENLPEIRDRYLDAKVSFQSCQDYGQLGIIQPHHAKNLTTTWIRR